MSWQCVIFDMDGTLVDSETLNLRAYADLIPEITDSVPVLVERYGGMKLDLVVQDIERRYGVSLPGNFETGFRLHVRGLYDAELQPIVGVPELLAGLSIPCCVASNAPLKKIEHALSVTGLTDYFDGNLFSAYDVGVWKPAPDLFLHTAAQMNVAPEHCAVIEDTSTGVEAGLLAGMTVFHYDPDTRHESRAEYQSIQQMAELTDLLGAGNH